jgi:hypothetical protein
MFTRPSVTQRADVVLTNTTGDLCIQGEAATTEDRMFDVSGRERLPSGRDVVDPEMFSSLSKPKGSDVSQGDDNKHSIGKQRKPDIDHVGVIGLTDTDISQGPQSSQGPGSMPKRGKDGYPSLRPPVLIPCLAAQVGFWRRARARVEERRKEETKGGVRARILNWNFYLNRI